jgi:hypothetical protein
MRVRGLTLVLFFFAIAALWADEPVRRVQEELRKRNLFFGDINGQLSPELCGALRAYQSRKGFEASGQIDEVTLRSLHVMTNEDASAAQRVSWPDVPVLKSDAARALPPDEQAALAQQAVRNVDASPTPVVEPMQPSGPAPVDRRQVERLVENYLRDGETNDVAKQTRYYEFPVDYFDHGAVGEKFVKTDTRRYVLRWPQRNYQLTAPIKVAAGAGEGEAVVEFPLHFNVRSESRHAEGKTRNVWTIKSAGNELKIVGIKEQHLHE